MIWVIKLRLGVEVIAHLDLCAYPATTAYQGEQGVASKVETCKRSTPSLGTPFVPPENLKNGNPKP